MTKIVHSESFKLRKAIQSLDNMDFQKVYGKIQILPQLIEKCRSISSIPFDCKIIILDRNKSKTIIDKYKQFCKNIEKEIIQFSPFSYYIKNQTFQIDKKLQGDKDSLSEYLKSDLSIKIATGRNSTIFNKIKLGIYCLTKLNSLNAHHIQKFLNCSVPYFSKSKKSLYRIFEESLRKFTNRNRDISFIGEIIKKKKIRKQNKLFINQVKKISKNIQEKKKKLVSEKVFLPLLSKGKALAFERKRVNSPYLFYSSYNTAPIELHIYNFISTQTKTFNFYKENGGVYQDVEQHENKIFICGGYYNGPIKTSWMIELSNLNIAQGHPTKDLVEIRYYHTLVSTPFELYALGGYANSNYTKTCEKFTKSEVWEKSEDLNQVSYYVTVSYVYPHYLYKFRAISSNIERLYLKSPSKWEDLNVQNSSVRYYGCPFQLNENEVLLINGGGALVNSKNSIYKIITYQIQERHFHHIIIVIVKLDFLLGKFT